VTCHTSAAAKQRFSTPPNLTRPCVHPPTIRHPVQSGPDYQGTGETLLGALELGTTYSSHNLGSSVTHPQTGRLLSERLGEWHFWLFLIGFHLTFEVMHVPGILGMPRRAYTYEPGRGWDTLNFVVSIGAFIQALAILVFVANLIISYFKGAPVTIPGTRGHWNGPSVRRPQHITLRRFQPWRVAARCGTRSIPRILKLHLRGHSFHPDWTYTISPRTKAT
jgi:heme/copper-type cytochrome/quinol oxidase subunit 1